MHQLSCEKSRGTLRLPRHLRHKPQARAPCRNCRKCRKPPLGLYLPAGGGRMEFLLEGIADRADKRFVSTFTEKSGFTRAPARARAGQLKLQHGH
jgi:hypothetical protein